MPFFIHKYNVTYAVMKNVLANGSCVLAIGVIVFDVFTFRGEQSCNSKLTCQVKCVTLGQDENYQTEA